MSTPAERPAIDNGSATIPLHEIVRRRHSPRAFADRELESDKLWSVLEAARWAPSSYNEQPWAYLVATRDDAEQFERLLSCLIEFNQQWARTAPVLMLSLAHLQFARNGKPNRHALHDVGAASAYLTVQAESLGLHVHQMAGFDGDRARALYSIPDDWEPVAALALGYLGDLARLPDLLREKERAPRSRKPVAEFVFASAFGSPLR